MPLIPDNPRVGFSNRRFLGSPLNRVLRVLALALLVGWSPASAQQESSGAEQRSTPASPDPWSRPVLRVDARPRLLSRWELRKLLEFQTGGPIRREDLRRSVENLLVTGRFSSVVPLREPTDGGDVLVFKLQPQPYVKKIRIRGNHLVRNSKIRNWLPLSYFSRLEPAHPDWAAGIVADRYEQNGFLRSEIRISSTSIGKGGAHRLEIRIEEATQPNLRGISLQNLPRLRFHERLWLSWRLHRGHIFTPARLNQVQLQGLRDYAVQYLKKIGFVDGTAEFLPPASEGTSGRSKAVLHIDAGKRVRLVVRGASSRLRRKLKKLFRAGKYSLSEQDRTRFLRKAQKALQKLGYSEEKLKLEIVEHERERVVQLDIIGGFQTTVRKIEFIGNESLSDAELRQVMLIRAKSWLPFSRNHYDPELVREDAKAMEAAFALRGFSSAHVEPKVEVAPSGDVSISFDVRQGPHRAVGRIRFRKQTAFPEQELLAIASSNGLRTGADLSQNAIVEAAQAITLRYFRKGYPDVRLRVGRAQTRGEQVDLEVEVLEGQRQTAGKLIALNNFKTSTKTMLRHFHWKEGEALDPNRIAALRQRLVDLGVFDTVLIETIVDETTGRTDMLAHVEERRAGLLDLSLLYDSAKGLGAEASLAHKNLLGRALGGELRSQALFQLPPETRLSSFQVGASLRKSIFFGQSIPTILVGDYSSDRTKENFDEERLRMTLSVARALGPHLQLSTGVSFENVNVKIKQASEDLPGQGRIFSISPGIVWDTRQNIVNPNGGLLATLRLKLAGSILRGQEEFVRADAEMRRYISLGEWTTLAAAIRGGFAVPFGDSTEVPPSERYFLGGDSTHRAFPNIGLGPRDEETGTLLGGTSFLLFNLEMRFPLWNELYGGIFFDLGNSYGFDEGFSLRPGLGLGLRYYTIVGPIRVDFGWNPARRSFVDPDDPTMSRQKEEARFKFHIALGHAF